MQSIDFSLNKWNFTVNFSNDEDYDFYFEQLYTSIDCMQHKTSGTDPIVINYLNKPDLYNMIYKSIGNKPRKKVQSFENEYYDYVENYFFSSKDRYILRNSGNKVFDMICSGKIERHELIYVIREIYVRLEENDKALFMHGNGIVLDGKGLILTGNSGSGKTTLMIKLFERNPNPCKFLSNDRVFITNDDNMDYFPIPLIVANGSCKFNPEIRRFLEGKCSLYDSEYERSMLYIPENNVKFALFRTYMPEIYKGLTLDEHHKLDAIILPKMDMNAKEITIVDEIAHQELQNTCFTPFDYESLRRPWIMQRNYSDVELFELSIARIKKQIEEGRVFRLIYNPNFPPEMIQEEVEKKLTRHM